MASIHTPKSQGEYLGKVSRASGNVITLDTASTIVNGDGLSFLDASGNYDGFRVNRVDGKRLILKDKCDIKAGDKVYKTFDKEFNDILAKPSAERKIAVDFTLWTTENMVCLKASDERGSMAVHTITLDSEPQVAKQPQSERQRQVLSKLGNTIFTLRNCDIMGDYFIPASTLTQLRRETLEMLERAHKNSYCRDLRRPEDKNAMFPYQDLASADNVANQLAHQFYLDHGVASIEPALECRKSNEIPSHPVMTTRYCLRRELGACLKERDSHNKLPVPLLLRNGKTLLRVDCDCKQCEMKISIVQT